MLSLTAKTPSQEEEEEEEGEDNEMDNEEEEEEENEEVRRKQKITIKVVSRRASSSSSSSSFLSCCCQADECGADLRTARRYNRRHKVCDRHAKAPVVLVSGTRQRFCQQCSKFHELALFDDTKRSCRERLASHNERRRKAHADPHAAGMEWTADSSHPTGPSQVSDD